MSKTIDINSYISIEKNMGIKDILSKKKTNINSSSTLEQDIPIAADWVVKALNSSGYKADYTLESMKEIDRFFDEQNVPGGILSKNTGNILFSLGSYIGQTIIKLYGGKWVTNDDDSKGEIKISIEIADGMILWPVIRCMKRLKNGAEDSIYAYVFVLESNFGNLMHA